MEAKERGNSEDNLMSRQGKVMWKQLYRISTSHPVYKKLMMEYRLMPKKKRGSTKMDLDKNLLDDDDSNAGDNQSGTEEFND